MTAGLTGRHKTAAVPCARDGRHQFSAPAGPWARPVCVAAARTRDGACRLAGQASEGGMGRRAGPRGVPGGSLPQASTVLWGGWLLVTGGVFSFMAGIIHPYYTVALVPAIGALTGIGAVELWRR